MFKYIGAKSRLLKTLIPAILDANKAEYREPFAGSGKVFTELLKHHQFEKVWINDKFPAVASFWAAVHRHPDDLVKELGKVKMWRDQPISLDDYTARRKEALALDRLPSVKTDLLYHAVNLFVVMMQTFDGNLLAGSPSRTVDRWHVPNYEKKIVELAGHMNKSKTTITAGDFEPLLSEGDAVVYCDPPYWSQGDGLYPHTFTADDHFRLSKGLRNSKSRWLVSYDVHDVVLGLYSWADVGRVRMEYSSSRKFWWAKVERVKIKYSAQGRNKWAEELLIRG